MDSSTKRKILKNRNRNVDIRPMKTIAGVSNLRLKKIFIKENNG